MAQGTLAALLGSLDGIHEGTSFRVGGVITQSCFSVSHGVGLKRPT